MIHFRVFLTVMLLSLFTICPAQAAGVVTDCTQYGPGAGTLQDALASGGTITFACSGTIIVPEIVISQDTTIDGSGQDVTLSGNNVNGVLSVDHDVTLNINQLTLANGSTDEGGAIDNVQGTVNISSSRFTDNQSPYGGAINNFGLGSSLSVVDSIFTNNTATYGGGGAISNNSLASLTVTNSVFTDNTAVSGGGAILAAGTETITNTTFSGNSTPNHFGGAVWVFYGNTHISNSTFFNNDASVGGAIFNWMQLTLINSTLIGNSAINGGGIYRGQESQSTIVNTIIVNNYTGRNCAVYGDRVENILKNFADDSSCSGFTQTTLSKLKLGTPTGDPAYFPLLPGSVAIDAGNNGLCPLIDQRGVSRPQGLGCDIGAYERLASLASASPGRNLYTVPMVALTWNEISWAAEYQIQVSFDPNFEVFILQDDLVPKESLSTLTPALSNGLYYWRVRAKDNANSWGKWSAVESFIVTLP